MLSDKMAVAHINKKKVPNAYTVASKQPLRDAIAFDVEVFLMCGGTIQHIPRGVSSYDDRTRTLHEISEISYNTKYEKNKTAASA